MLLLFTFWNNSIHHVLILLDFIFSLFKCLNSSIQLSFSLLFLQIYQLFDVNRLTWWIRWTITLIILNIWLIEILSLKRGFIAGIANYLIVLRVEKVHTHIQKIAFIYCLLVTTWLGQAITIRLQFYLNFWLLWFLLIYGAFFLYHFRVKNHLFIVCIWNGIPTLISFLRVLLGVWTLTSFQRFLFNFLTFVLMIWNAPYSRVNFYLCRRPIRWFRWSLFWIGLNRLTLDTIYPFRQLLLLLYHVNKWLLSSIDKMYVNDAF